MLCFCISAPTWVTISSLIVHNVSAETSRLFRYCMTYQADNTGQIFASASSLPSCILPTSFIQHATLILSAFCITNAHLFQKSLKLVRLLGIARSFRRGMSPAVIGRGQRNSSRANKQTDNFLAIRLRPGLVLHLGLRQETRAEQALSGLDTRQRSSTFC